MSNRSTAIPRLAAIAAAFVFGSALAASDTANVSATVFTPVTVTNTAGLSFGNMLAATGTVAVGTGGSATLSSVSRPGSSNTGTVSAASFNITGQPSSAISISLGNLTSNALDLSDGASHTMSVDTFTVKLDSGSDSTWSGSAITGTLGAGGTSVVKVGGTLNVLAATTPGAYTGSFTLSVDYN